jgi:hypothetical protein
MTYGRIGNHGFTELNVDTTDLKEITVGDRTYWIESEGPKNRYLSELTGMEVNGYGYTPIIDSKDLKRLNKHYESVAHDKGWDICPMCDERIVGTGALSRVDNTTTICSDCGLKEGLQDFNRAKETEFAQEVTRIKTSDDYATARSVIKDMKESFTTISSLIDVLQASGAGEDESVDARMTDIWVNTIVIDAGVITLLSEEFVRGLESEITDVDEMTAMFESAFTIGAHYMLRRLGYQMDAIINTQNPDKKE